VLNSFKKSILSNFGEILFHSTITYLVVPFIESSINDEQKLESKMFFFEKLKILVLSLH
jgi:hypothetical protein